MHKKSSFAVIALTIASLIAPLHVRAGEMSGNPQKGSPSPFLKSGASQKPVSYESRRMTKPGNPECFIDVMKLGSVTAVNYGSGLKQIFKNGVDGRLESVTNNGGEYRLRYDGPRSRSKIVGIETPDGGYTSMDDMMARVHKRKGLAPRMTAPEATAYMQRQLEKNWCPTKPSIKPVAFMKVDSEDIPEEYFDIEYWDTIVVTASPYDPVCNESDCTELVTSWRDMEIITCAIGAGAFWFAPAAAAVIGAVCAGATIGVWASKMSDCGDPPESWGCY